MDSLNVALLAVEYALDNHPLWASRIHFGNVPPEEDYPYIWVIFQGGGDRNEDFHSDPLYTLAVTISSDDQQEALHGKGYILDLLNDRGRQDVNPTISGMNGWVIRTITAASAIYMEDPIDNAARVYRAGYQFLFNMEASG